VPGPYPIYPIAMILGRHAEGLEGQGCRVGCRIDATNRGSVGGRIGEELVPNEETGPGHAQT
jgi:hypothetical protein